MADAADKLRPWFTGWASPWSLLAEATSIASARAPMAESGVESADGLFPYASTVPGSHRAGPGDPGGALYGRTEDPTGAHSTDGPDGRAFKISVEGEGLKATWLI